MTKRIITTDAELIGAPVDIWMRNHLCEKNQMIHSYSSKSVQSNDNYYLRTNVQIVWKGIHQ
ncbi:hypothetical protein BSK57_29370 [Paenibacillus odorifer]|nr:hypothetical protein BSK57_29370 [Paenibacillus odorifer]